MPDILIEIGCEELPSSACREAIAQAPALLTDALAALVLTLGPDDLQEVVDLRLNALRHLGQHVGPVDGV